MYKKIEIAPEIQKIEKDHRKMYNIFQKYDELILSFYHCTSVRVDDKVDDLTRIRASERLERILTKYPNAPMELEQGRDYYSGLIRQNREELRSTKQLLATKKDL
jgi:hypothetical protein